MNVWHKRLIYLQCVLLLAAALLFSYPSAAAFYSKWVLLAFFLLEIGVLETQRRENPAAVRYQKSCFMALLDILSVCWYLGLIIALIFKNEVPGWHFQALFVYIILRKLYITKNYSYEI